MGSTLKKVEPPIWVMSVRGAREEVPHAAGAGAMRSDFRVERARLGHVHLGKRKGFCGLKFGANTLGLGVINALRKCGIDAAKLGFFDWKSARQLQHGRFGARMAFLMKHVSFLFRDSHLMQIEVFGLCGRLLGVGLAARLLQRAARAFSTCISHLIEQKATSTECCKGRNQKGA